MILAVLNHIRDSLNQHFKNEFNTDKILVLSNLVNSDGGTPENVVNKMVLLLVGISEESTLKNAMVRRRNGQDGNFLNTPKSLHFNLNLLFCANFEGQTGYEEGLVYLSSLLRYFQMNKVMLVPHKRSEIGSDGVLSNLTTPSNNQVSTLTNKVNFDLTHLDYNELSHLWSAIGGKLRPSALYKVGIVSFDDTPVQATIPPIMQTDSKF